MPNITINGRFLTRPATGVDRFAQELSRSWLQQFQGDSRVRVAVPNGCEIADERTLGIPTVASGCLKGHAWEQFELSRICENDILLSLCNTGPVVRAHSN